MKRIAKLLRYALQATALTIASLAPAHAAGNEPAPKSLEAVVNGVKLHYLRQGSGPAIVLLHGYAETGRMWLPLMPALAKTHAVIAPDLRGAGGSAKPEGGYDKKTMAQDIHALVQSLGLGPIQIVGHDIGLMVA